MTTIEVPAYAAQAVQRFLNAVIPHIQYWRPIDSIPKDRDVLLYGVESKFSTIKYRLGYYDNGSQQAEWYGDFDDRGMWTPTHWADVNPPEVCNESSK